MTEYRELGAHEVIDLTKGDEYSLNGNWIPTSYLSEDCTTPFTESQKAGRYHMYRRPVGADAIGGPQIPVKESNPKDSVGVTKPPIHNIPRSVLSEVGMALAEGEYKYGGYNWRAVGVRASVYLDALDRHMTAWWEGEDLDPDCGLSHITKAISALMVLRDGMIQENWVDDRPPKSKMDRKELAGQYKEMLSRLKSLQPEPTPGYTQKGIDDGSK